MFFKRAAESLYHIVSWIAVNTSLSIENRTLIVKFFFRTTFCVLGDFKHIIIKKTAVSVQIVFFEPTVTFYVMTFSCRVD